MAVGLTAGDFAARDLLKNREYNSWGDVRQAYDDVRQAIENQSIHDGKTSDEDGNVSGSFSELGEASFSEASALTTATATSLPWYPQPGTGC